MALIICKIHGDQGVVHLCTHLYDNHLKKEFNASTHHLKKDQLGMVIYLCDKCIRKHNLSEVQTLDFDDLAKISDDLLPVCNKCFALNK